MFRCSSHIHASGTLGLYSGRQIDRPISIAHSVMGPDSRSMDYESNTLN